jgi:hypothetical protein
MDRYKLTATAVDDFVRPGKLRRGCWVCPQLKTRPETPLTPEQYELYTVRQDDLGRLDRVAWQFYQDVTLWWAIAYYNSIANPLSDMVVGQAIMIPRKQFLLSLFDTES